MPGVLVLDHVLAGLRAALQRDAVRLPRVKFLAAMQAEETGFVHCTLRGDTVAFRVSADRNGKRQTLAEGAVALVPLSQDAA